MPVNYCAINELQDSSASVGMTHIGRDDTHQGFPNGIPREDQARARASFFSAKISASSM